MMSFRLLSFLLLLTPNVLGGSSSWQPQLEYHEPHPPIAIDASGYAVRNEASEALVRKRKALVEKRYLSLRPDNEVKLWPDKTISYCFRDTTSRTELQRYILDATKLWQMAGLHRDVYKFKEVADPGDKCVNSKDRAFTLVITYDADGGNDCTVGVMSLNTNYPAYKGPSMNIGDESEARIVSVIAHELGHAWGLFHEHQNRVFWAEPYAHQGGTAFGSNFNCKGIENYTQVLEEAVADGNGDEAQICLLDYVASKYGFAADQWLPDTSLQRNSPWGQADGKGEAYIDMRSIMIYASESFSADPDQAVLRTNAGITLYENPIPTHSDVEGIRRIYEDDFNSRHEAPVLPNSSKSIWYSKFADMFRDNVGC